MVSNAGGLNPAGLVTRLGELAAKLGLAPKIAYVEGDDLSGRIDELTAAGHPLSNMDTGRPLAEAGAIPVSANAYLGGWGIAEALTAGADIVVCPRVTDASLVVGPAAWWHGWQRTDFDALAGAVAAGHVIECGPQATGGNYSWLHEITDRRYPGFPIAEVEADGSSVITKHPGTGGLVSLGTVTAQLLYEIAEPAYLYPDVVARFDTLRLYQQEPMDFHETDEHRALRAAVGAITADFGGAYYARKAEARELGWRAEEVAYVLGHSKSRGIVVESQLLGVMSDAHTMTGYLDNPEATAKAFEHGWFHSGDVEYFDADGILWFSDRRKDVIKSGGENVSSMEVEEAIFEANPDIAEAVVVGLPHERWTEAITAVVVPKRGKQIDGDALLEGMRGLIDRYKVPKAVIVTDQLPRTSTGKIQKNVVRENFARYYTGEAG